MRAPALIRLVTMQIASIAQQPVATRCYLTVRRGFKPFILEQSNKYAGKQQRISAPTPASTLEAEASTAQSNTRPSRIGAFATFHGELQRDTSTTKIDERVRSQTCKSGSACGPGTIIVRTRFRARKRAGKSGVPRDAYAMASITPNSIQRRMG